MSRLTPRLPLLRHSLSALAVCVAGSTLLSCDAEDFSIQLYNVIPTNAECKPVNLATESLAGGTIDLALSPTYSLNLVAQNRLTNMVTANGLRPADGFLVTTTINITSLSVRYIDVDAVDLGIDPEVNLPISGVLPVLATANTSSANRTGTVVLPQIKVLDEQMVEILSQNNAFRRVTPTGKVIKRGNFKVVLAMRLFGETLDGKEVQSNEVQFPVNVCLGCLVTSSTQTACGAELVEEDLDLLETCPSMIGHDNTLVSCSLCQQVAPPDYVHLCSDR
jgi:hypothetical protein